MALVLRRVAEQKLARTVMVRVLKSVHSRVSWYDADPDYLSRMYGEGTIIKNKCTHCHGEGVVKGEEVVEINIPAGVAERYGGQCSG